MRLLGTAARELIGRAWSGDVFHLTASLALVQGGVYLSQLIVARILGPAEFGYVRIVETTLAILVIPGGAGFSAAVVRFVAAARGHLERDRALVACIVGVLVASLATALFIQPLIGWLPLQQNVAVYLRWLVWTVVFTNLARVVINYFQGIKEIRRVALYNAALSLLGITAVAIGAAAWGLPGWALARATGELAFGLVLVWVVRRSLTAGFSLREASPIFRLAGYVTLGTALDRIASTADTLYLGKFIPDTRVVGYYGVAAIGISVASLVPAAVNAIALPRLSEHTADTVRVKEMTLRLLRTLMPATGGIGVLLLVLGPWLLRTALGAEYQVAGGLLQGLVPVLVLGVLNASLGTVLLALGRSDLAVVQSAAGVVTNVALNAILLPRLGVWGAVWAANATSLVRAALLWWMVRFCAAAESDYLRASSSTSSTQIIPPR